jgi:hypothetical protein
MVELIPTQSTTEQEPKEAETPTTSWPAANGKSSCIGARPSLSMKIFLAWEIAMKAEPMRETVESFILVMAKILDLKWATGEQISLLYA